MRIERRDGFRLWVGGPVPPGADAWTLGSLVIVRRRAADSVHLLAHELEHVCQYERAGFVGFLVRYVLAYLSWRVRLYGHDAAYRRIPAEVSAEWRARRRLGIGVGDGQHTPTDLDAAARAGDHDPVHLPPVPKRPQHPLIRGVGGSNDVQPPHPRES